MKNKIFLGIGIIALLVLSGCTSYNCRVGTKVNDNCYTEPITEKLELCKRIPDYYSEIIEAFIYELNEISHETESNCVIEELEIINITNFSINDSNVKFEKSSHWDYYFIENMDFAKDICFNITYTYRWRRNIWNKDTSFPFCLNEIKNAGGECDC